MSYTFQCHKCKLKMEIEEDLYGIKFDCPTCGQSYVVEPEVAVSEKSNASAPSPAPANPTTTPPKTPAKIHIKKPEDREWK